MKISVVICAYTENRWDDVLAAVGSVHAQSLPAHEVVVVVDHNPALLGRLRPALPGVRVIPNSGPRGLSGGKNAGVAAATGDVIAFLDDDAIAEAEWLASMAARYDRPEVAGVGGLTLPMWNASAPRWFPGEFAWVVGCTYRGMVAGPVRNLMGGNASFRREVFDLAGGFRNGIGRTAGGRPLGCEETEFCIRLRQAVPETVLLFEDRAVIWHRVPSERARFSYFRSRCYAEGLSKAMVTQSVGVGDGLASERRHALVALPRGVAYGLRAAVTGDPYGLGRAASIVAGLAFTTAGYAAGSIRRSERRPPAVSKRRTEQEAR
ncbi:glycosyltransferase family 2 protein [Actinomadura sp. DC4]|uniref:glycosyltransferase family 2 protein n=1 Tax=Actinomadura sp. DC4 TaxID=3055069 RepID=UPI0025B0F5FF|nr:glycosyltransferase family 2 protein [Actinomadura sp. DC4]MDN3359203.1 glycosyltransferase family 2 protein [Actinomadura sp. DC4]